MGGDPDRCEQPRGRTRLGRANAAARQRIEYWRHSHLVRRLQAADVINQGLLLAAVLLFSFLPFLLVFESVTGRDHASGFIRRFGLTGEAARAVRQALTAPTAPSTAVSGLSWVFFVLFGIAAAGALQELYGSVFDVKGRGFRDAPRRVVWLAAVLGVIFAGAWAQPWLNRLGGLGLVAIAALPVATVFWWFSMWLLLGSRLGWRELFPSALATGICWLGMVIVFRLTLSSTIVSSYRKYGSAGVVFAITPLLIAIGVVVILGALLGVAWRERHEHPLGEQPNSPDQPGVGLLWRRRGRCRADIDSDPADGIVRSSRGHPVVADDRESQREVRLATGQGYRGGDSCWHRYPRRRRDRELHLAAHTGIQGEAGRFLPEAYRNGLTRAGLRDVGEDARWAVKGECVRWGHRHDGGLQRGLVEVKR